MPFTGVSKACRRVPPRAIALSAAATECCGPIYGFEGQGIHVSGPTQIYQRGKAVDFHFCPVCGCVAYWRAQQLEEDGRRGLAVNLRLTEPQFVAKIPVDNFEGVDTFEPLPRDGRCVADYWA